MLVTEGEKARERKRETREREIKKDVEIRVEKLEETTQNETPNFNLQTSQKERKNHGTKSKLFHYQMNKQYMKES
jgi:hypothetical protein